LFEFFHRSRWRSQQNGNLSLDQSISQAHPHKKAGGRLKAFPGVGSPTGEAMFASTRRALFAAMAAYFYIGITMLFLVMEVVFPQP
jgi:hypothetical protein